MNKLILFCLVAFTLSQHQIQAQKFGHVNSALIIQVHPNIATANKQLEAFQKSLLDPYDLKTKAFGDKYKTYMEESNDGTLSKVAAQNRQLALQTEQDSLATEEQQIKFRLMQKREELLQPILTDVDSVIQVVGKEGNYTMIFDTSVTGALLFTEEKDDLTEVVKARLKK